MKRVFFSSLVLLSMVGMMNISEAKILEVQGRLELSYSIDGQLVPTLENGGEVLTITQTQTLLEGCEEGVFWITRQYGATPEADQVTLVEILSCEKDSSNQLILDEPRYCPEIWAPVCGDDGRGPQTYGNLCEMGHAEALLISEGECSSAALER